MKQNSKKIAIITARSGSKGLPDKNIRPLAGIPLIAYTIRAALESGLFDTVMVSTDSEEYARISREYGAEVPFLRSAETSGDTAGSWDVVREVLRKYKEMGKEFDTICLLQPTSPLRTAEDIHKAFAFMEERKANNLISCAETGLAFSQICILTDSYLVTDSIRTEPISSDSYKLRRQDAQKTYRANGAIYIVNKKIEDPSYGYLEDTCCCYVMPKERSIDIDSLLDFAIAEAVLKYQDEINSLENRQ